MLKPASTYIVLVNWNSWRDTIECLESVFRIDHPDYVVVVCDNASQDGSLEHIREWARGERPAECGNPALAHLVSPPIPKPIRCLDYSRTEAEQGGKPGETAPLVLIQTGANLGFAGGNNVGFRYALARGDADYVWALNNDTVVAPDSLSALIRRSGQANDHGIVGSTLCYYDDPTRIQAMGCASYSRNIGLAAPLGSGEAAANVSDSSTTYIESKAAYVVGASMLVPRSFLDDVGLMCEDYFLYFEELDWAERGRWLGYSSLYAPRSTVYHKVGAATKRTARSNTLSLPQQCSYRNRLLVTKKFFPDAQLAVTGRFLLEAMRALLHGRVYEARFLLQCVLVR